MFRVSYWNWHSTNDNIEWCDAGIKTGFGDNLPPPPLIEEKLRGKHRASAKEKDKKNRLPGWRKKRYL